ncbi:MAG: hypothetical protein OXC40_01545 [Proteobacteria bacterium]|nr:hypothetical protein [Pseudomonadota bacterium]
MLFRRFILLLIFGWLCWPAQNYAAPQTINTPLIRKLMKAEEYDKASILLRALLIQQPKNDAAWNMLGVSYYYMGKPEKALETLKVSQSFTSQKSYNFLFQGLAYSLLKEFNLAAFYLKKAANIKKASPYKKLATYELAAWYYNRRKLIRAKRWIGTYHERYPNDPRTETLLHTARLIGLGKMEGYLAGIKKPDIQQAFFKYAPLSLMNHPHYWFIESGAIYSDTHFNRVSSGDDAPDSFVAPVDDIVWALSVITGVGLGPYEYNDLESYFGYTYIQHWNTDVDRISVYLQDPSDLMYIPLRPDLLSRHHLVYSKFKFSPQKHLSLGLTSYVTTERIGSRYFSGPEPWSRNDNLLIAYSWNLTPWLSVNFNPRHSLKSYLYINQEINKEDSAFSYQTFDLTYIPRSLGLMYQGQFPKLNFSTEIDGYYYFLTYNDPFLDHQEIGGSVKLTYHLYKTLYISLVGNYARRTYIEDYLRRGSCSFRTKESASQPSISVSSDGFLKCTRVDEIYRGQLSINYTFGDYYGFFIRADYIKNNSLIITEMSFSNYYAVTGVSMTFPDVPKTNKYRHLHTLKPIKVGEKNY